MNIDDVRIMPSMTAWQITALCQAHSKPGAEVYCRIASLNGKMVAYLARETAADFIPPPIRRQAG